MGSRRKARELALQMLYQVDMTGIEPDEVFPHFDDLKKVPAETRDYACSLVKGTVFQRDEIDKMIVRQAENWRLERMPIVDRNILRLAVYELLNCPETPAAVVIDEALEIAKRFSTPKSSQFVNGILDGIRKRVLSEAAVVNGSAS